MIWLIIFIILCLVFPLIPFLIKNFHRIMFWGVRDTYEYFKKKKYNVCPYFGQVWITAAYRNKVFGSGKTLDVSKFVREIYRKYNNLPVYDEEKKAFVTQHLHIISNITFNDIPYVKFTNVNQLMNVEQEEQDVTIFVFDEIGAIWNSRNFKDNISTELLRKLLQVRHNKIFIIGTSQRFKFVDALLRQITGCVFCVRKYWRVLRKIEYDPMDLENCTNSDMLKPIRTKYLFITNRDYNAYDTTEIVGQLSKDDFLPDEQILVNQGLRDEYVETAHVKRKFRKKRR